MTEWSQKYIQVADFVICDLFFERVVRYATLSAFEGEPVARFFAGRGWNASVCEYGVEEKARMPGPLLQLAQAVAQARRENDFVAVCGFSAGANLAALLCTRYEEAARLLGTKPEAVRPDAAVLG